MSLPLRDRGAGFPFSMWLVAFCFALALAIAAGAFVLQVFAAQPRRCEAGPVGGLGLALAFGAMSYVLARVAWHGLRSTVAFNRRAGQVTLGTDWMTVDVPGIVEEPWRVHRSWILTATAADRSDHHGASFSVLVTAELETVITFRQPLSVRSACAAPQIPRAINLPPPRAWQPVRAISLDFVDPERSVESIRRLLTTGAGEPTPVPPDPPADHRRRRYRTVIPIAVGVAGLLAFLVAASAANGC